MKTIKECVPVFAHEEDGEQSSPRPTEGHSDWQRERGNSRKAKAKSLLFSDYVHEVRPTNTMATDTSRKGATHTSTWKDTSTDSLVKDGQSRIELKDQMSTILRENTRVQCRLCDAISKEKSAVGLRTNRNRENREFRFTRKRTAIKSIEARPRITSHGSMGGGK